MTSFDQFLSDGHGKLYRGTIASIDRNTFACEIQPDNLSTRLSTIPGRIHYPYANTADKSGMVFFPKVGSKVIYQTVIEGGMSYAWVIAFGIEHIVNGDFTSNGMQTIQNPGFEGYGDPKKTSYRSLLAEDQGFEPGDLLLRGSKGNKIKVMDDGGLILKSTPYNIDYYSPMTNAFYKLCQHRIVRTPGSLDAEYNIVTTKEESDSSFHYAVRRHVINPSEQQLAFQEEFGLIDKTLRASAGNFDDVPNTDLVKATALFARTQDDALRSILGGPSVYKRKLFDLGGRDFSKKPEEACNEYFTEEIKSDGAYRLRVGTKKNSDIKARTATEILFTPSGEWSIGSQYGKIQVTATDMILSNASFEISMTQLVNTLMTHKHIAQGSPTTPAMLTPTPQGMSVGYVASSSKIPDPRLSWNT